MWTAENRSLYNRDKLRYPSDLTDAEWRRIDPLTPPARSGDLDLVALITAFPDETATADL